MQKSVAKAAELGNYAGWNTTVMHEIADTAKKARQAP
jgi:hypothetical protein